MITNEEARKAIEKYQKEHPLQFGTMIDVTAISSKAGAEIISRTVEEISKKIEEDTGLWCICEMAKMYMQGVKPVYPVRPQSEWISVSERLPEINVDVIVTDIETTGTYSAYYQGDGFWECDNGSFKNRVIAWMPFPEPYKEGGAEE